MPKTTTPRKPHGLTGRPSNRAGTGKLGETTTLSLRVPAALREALTHAAESKGVSVNALAIEALRKAAG